MYLIVGIHFHIVILEYDFPDYIVSDEGNCYKLSPKSYFKTKDGRVFDVNLDDLGQYFSFDVIDVATGKLTKNVKKLGTFIGGKSENLLNLIDPIHLPGEKNNLYVVLVKSSLAFWNFLGVVDNAPEQIDVTLHEDLHNSFVDGGFRRGTCEHRIHTFKNELSAGQPKNAVDYIKSKEISSYFTYLGYGGEVGDLSINSIDSLGLFYHITDDLGRIDIVPFEYADLLEVYRIFVYPFTELLQNYNINHFFTSNFCSLVEVNKKILHFLVKYNISRTR
jgi:hypothetical protein